MTHLFLHLFDLLLEYDLIALFVGGFVVPPILIPHCGILLVELLQSLVILLQDLALSLIVG